MRQVHAITSNVINVCRFSISIWGESVSLSSLSYGIHNTIITKNKKIKMHTNISLETNNHTKCFQWSSKFYY